MTSMPNANDDDSPMTEHDQVLSEEDRTTQPDGDRETRREPGTTGSDHGSHGVTIRDVAREVGVSPSTVSRAFARPGRVSAETARRIREAADRLGYRAKAVTSLNMHDTEKVNGMLAITVADLGNPIFADYVKSAQHQCLRKGFGLLVIDFEETSIIERKALNLAMGHVDGLILSSSRSSDATIRKLAEITPLIALNRPIRGVQSIIPDARVGLEKAVEHLATLGHEEITYLSGPEASWQDGRRWRTMIDICERLHLRLRRINANAPSYIGGYKYADEFLRTPTTAVIAYNDIVAIGFMKAMQARGIKVPEEISVVGIDDTPVSSLVTPSLSTVKLPRKEPAELAVDEIIAQVRHQKTDVNRGPLFLKSTFIPRCSTAQANPAIHLR
ncbi:LacI family DNA-binding transcriptional regulator [Bifidobacterium simiarum]|uniref:LacI family DNA-binding transcriptional regulator n=1 Tax=Bifidobacterium simiarum TaxID=2045441 RepID=UPI001BDD75EA|nr:LacI family DNA-binding transcriptional regulator [Bifidobacterium simiarum]MBT1166043.1 LacI family DNA-binding transcriptional regulator [Bifidobacterium simiarum]